MHANPFSFPGFIMQIGKFSFFFWEKRGEGADANLYGVVCITVGPAFFSAAIYFTLSQM